MKLAVTVVDITSQLGLRGDGSISASPSHREHSVNDKLE
jgi:hypothetical protein